VPGRRDRPDDPGALVRDDAEAGSGAEVMAMRRMRPLERLILALEAFLAIGAFGGVWALIGDRNGGDNVDMTLLEGTPFDSYLVPGIALLVLNGVFPALVVMLALRGHRLAWPGHVAVGAVLMTWIAVQVGFIGYASLLQPFFFVYGAAVAALGAVGFARETHARMHLPGAGGHGWLAG